jgi:hypothetical protein
MKKILAVVALFALLAGTFTACDDSATYAEQLSDEKDAIKEFIKDNKFTVGDTIPTVTPWPKGYYYKTESGLYVHVIDTGTQVIDTIPNNTVISVRFYELDMDGEETYSNMYGSDDAYEILYNNVNSTASYGDCLAWHEGLDYVGDYGHIQMIVPASLGMSYYTTSSALTAVFYDLRYTFWK